MSVDQRETRTKPKRAAIYARISDDPEGREVGVQRQIEDCLEMAERDGWTLGPWQPFVDNDVSASTLSNKPRPEYNRMMELVAAGEIDGILFYSNSRLTRRPREYEDIIELYLRTKVHLQSRVSSKFDLATADGRQAARFQAVADAAEAERTSERVTRAFKQRREVHKQPNPSSRAFGFEKGGVKVIEEEAKLIREAASRILDDGWSLGMVVNDWNKRQIPTVRGAGGWTRTTLSRTLLNPRVAGMISLGDEILGRGNFDAILTREQQTQMREGFTARRKGNTTTFRERKHWLAGFMVCGKCQRPMKVNALYDDQGALRKDSYVICSRSQYGCGGVKRNLLHVMEYVDTIIRVRIDQAIPVETESVEAGVAEKIAELQATLTEIEEDIEDAETEFKAGRTRFRDYNSSLAILRDRQEMTEQSLRDLSANKIVSDDIDLLATWEDGSVEEKREVMAWAIDHIKLHPIGRVGPIRARALLPTATEIVPRMAG